MINRGRNQASAYVFNSKTGKLEKQEDKVNTIESLAKQAKKHLKSLEDIAAAVNKEDNEKPVNNIVVITAQDNLIHNYFTSIDISWDASNCLSTAIIKMPKLNVQNLSYWTTYTGQLTIYVGNDFVFDYVNANSNINEQDAANSLVKYWDNSNIKPFFRGEISRVKEFENDVTIYVDSIGRRFQQKIPDDFRQSFINNQNVRDAFQAICEFLGVFYICPPKTVTDNGETSTTDDQNPSTDGTENDLSTQQQAEQNMQQIAKNKVNQQQSSTSGNNQDNNNSSTDNQNNNTDTTDENSDLTNNEEVPDIQNGYGDINFDANGAIVHGSTVIETSPDMAETLIAMEENPFEQYLEDETGIIEYVQKFLDGDMFDELHNRVMDYGAITVEPKSTSSSDISSVSTGATDSSGSSPNGTDENGDSQNSSQGGSSSSSSGGKTYMPTARAIAGHTAAKALSKDYINTLTPEQARLLRTSNYASGKYTSDTMQKLLWRSLGIVLR